MTLIEEIQNGENVALEFKEALSKDSLKFTKTVVAFANGKGGRLIIGIEDVSRNIVGIPRDRVFSEMDAIVNMKDVEGWGGGVSRYFEKCAELGLPPPKVEEIDGGFFRVTFYRDARSVVAVHDGNEDKRDGKSEGKSEGKSKGKSKGKSMVKSADRIVALLAEDPTLRQSAIAEKVGLSIPGVEKIMRHLRVEGRLIREGSSRNGRWKVV